MMNMVGENSNPEILSVLLRQSFNLDCIIDDDERQKTADQFGWDMPTMSERVEYIKNHIKTSSSDKSRAAWSAMIYDDELFDPKGYHELRNQRLREQIRQTKKKVETAWDEAERRSIVLGRTGGAEVVSWEAGENVPLDRINTSHPTLDRWFGTTVEEVRAKGSNGSKTVEVETHGIVKGFSYALGAQKGTGKTRLMVSVMRDLCGPLQTRSDGVEFGGNTGLYIQSEIPDMSRFRSVFLRNAWESGKVNVNFSQVGLLDEVCFLVERDRPDFLVIDSKEMIHEFTGPDGRVREGMLRFNELLVRTGCTAFIISHIAKSTGDLKGSSMFAHSVDAVILGGPDEHGNARVNLAFNKNRGGEVRNTIRWLHNKFTIELDEGKVIKSDDKPELTRLSARGKVITDHSEGETASAILRAIATASGRPVENAE